jgi:hypothetical protein
MLFASCAKYDDKKVEGVWLLEHINLCVSGDCFDTLQDRGTRDKYDKIELRLSRSRDAQARFYKTGILLNTFEFEFILDEKIGRISFLGPNDRDFQNFFGAQMEIIDLKKKELTYQAIEDVPNEETIYIFKRLQ